MVAYFLFLLVSSTQLLPTESNNRGIVTEAECGIFTNSSSVYIDEHCFIFTFDEMKPYPEARKSCNHFSYPMVNGHLAYIRTKALLHQLRDAAPSECHETACWLFIGMKQIPPNATHHNANWYWIDADARRVEKVPENFPLWHSDPDELKYRHAAIYINGQANESSIGTKPFEEKHAFLCEYEPIVPTTTEEPTTSTTPKSEQLTNETSFKEIETITDIPIIDVETGNTTESTSQAAVSTEEEEEDTTTTEQETTTTTEQETTTTTEQPPSTSPAMEPTPMGAPTANCLKYVLNHELNCFEMTGKFDGMVAQKTFCEVNIIPVNCHI